MVVLLVAIYVMHNFAWQQCSAKHLFGYYTMLVAAMPLAVSAWLY
jgi:hypothetical protein